MARLPLALVFGALVWAAPIARAYEPYFPEVGPRQVDVTDLSTPLLPVPRIYDYSRPPSILDSQPKVTNCVQTTYGYRCSTF
jgi:hypothetical protein